MSIQSQLDLIRKQQMIEDNGIAEARQVFRAAVFVFRKWLSPVRSPAPAWLDNVETMMIKCRLDGDAQTLAELLAVRAAAQIDATVLPGDYDELAKAAGLDVLSSSETSIGQGGRITIGEDVTEAGAYRIVLKGLPIVIRNAPVEGELETGNVVEAIAAVDRLSQRNTGGQRFLEIGYTTAPKTDIEIFDTVHDPWRPSFVYSSELKAHPKEIIEPSTLAATPLPAPTYKPLLPAEAIKRGFISDAQFETIVYACAAVTSYLPGSPSGAYGRRPKGGYIIGDGTGVGKTNEIAGVILDQWMRGKKRHIIVVERAKHVAHVQEAWMMLGGSSREVVFQGAYGAKDRLPDRDAVLITTYALIRDDRRYAELLEWANGRREFDGILAFDEAHNMRNAIDDQHEEGAGKGNQSQQGMRGVELQEALPEGGVIYASATMATDVYNLGYAPRLGLWGEHAPFATEQDFIGQMYLLDEAALEQVCIDLKAAGRYCSRTLSFDGVEYDEIVHRLTPHQRTLFDNTVKGWKELHSLLAAAKISTGGRQYWFSKGRMTQIRRALVEQLLGAFTVDTLVEDIHKEIAAGNAPVIQIAHTGEARLKRLADGRTFIPVEDFRDDEIIKFVENSFPETKMIVSERGEAEVKTDASGNPIPDPEAIKLKERAIAIAEELALRNSVLDRLLLEFGPDQLAEVTGRSIRAIPEFAAGEHVGWRIEDRSSQAAMDDVQAFHDGRKPILVFSLAAGGTGLGYHAAEKSKNKRRRIHYIVELGRRAEQAVQGLGRSHRADQVIAPHVKLVSSDIPAHAIYAANTLLKISKMGALSRGHQHATTNAIFEQRVPIKGKYAQAGWTAVLKEIAEGKVGDLTIESLATDLGLEANRKEGGVNIHSLEDAIKRLATISSGDQHLIVDLLKKRTEDAITAAIRQGSYNQGLETIRADSIQIVDENRLTNANGSITTYFRLRKRENIELLPFSRAAMTAAAARAKRASRAVFLRHKVNGRVILAVSTEGPSGIVDIFSPAGTATRSIDALRQEPWKLIESHADAQRLWELESETLDLRGEADIHILSGSLLYNWDKLPQSGAGLNRCQTDDGRVIVGRVINARDLRKTMSKMGMRSSYSAVQIATMLASVDKGARIELDNGWAISPPYNASGDYRLIVPDEEQTGGLRQDLASIGILAHDTPLGFELEIPRSSASTIIQTLAVGCDLSLKGTTINGTAKPPIAAPLMAMAACKA